MPRSFPTAFTSHLTDKAIAPYYVLEIQWGDPIGTKYYLDRKTDSFSASGTRCPGSVEQSLVLDWGTFGLQMKEMQIGAVDSFTIKLEDHAGQISSILNAGTPHTIIDNADPYAPQLLIRNPMQKRVVRIWQLFDLPDVTWNGGTDGSTDALIFVGTTKPFAWSEVDNVISIEVEDPARLLTQSVGCPATEDVFAYVSKEYKDRSIPIVWGYAERVEAICVEQPWQVHTLEAFKWPDAWAGGLTIAIDLHPDDLGIPLTAGVSDAIDVYIGNNNTTRSATGKFHLSANKATTPSTFEITSVAPEASSGTATGAYIQDVNLGAGHLDDDSTSAAATGTVRARIAVDQSTMSPPEFQASPESYLRDGVACQIQQGGVWKDATIRSAFADNPAGYTAVAFYESEVTLGLDRDQPIVFWFTLNNDLTHTGNYSVAAGTTIEPRTGNWVYACNALRSKKIWRVEGYGSVPSNMGDPGKKDFVQIADTFRTAELNEEIGIYISTESSAYTVDLNDDTWNLGTGHLDDLGHNITTITFTQAPRRCFPQLDDNRIWVTLEGTVKPLSPTTLISNPVDVILEYLQNTSLMNIDSSAINLTSFSTARTAIKTSMVDASEYVLALYTTSIDCGFAQIEQKDGLELLQDIARQCHCLLFFDQGQVTIKALFIDPEDTSLTLDEDTIKAESLQVMETDVFDVVSRLIADWRYQWDDKVKERRIVAINNNVETAIQKNEKNFEVYIYNERGNASREVGWWLVRWSRVYREVSFTTFSLALPLQPGDWITLSYVQGVLATGTDLVYEGSNTVSSASWTFTQLDVGRLLTVTTPAGDGVFWVHGSYSIDSVTEDGKAVLSSAPASHTTTAGSWKLGGLQIIPPETDCEVLETKARSDGLVDLKVRYAQFMYQLGVGIVWSGGGLSYTSGVTVSGGDYTFTSEDVGRTIIITNTGAPNWISGAYTIESVSAGNALLNAAPATAAASDGSWQLRVPG